MTLPRQDFYPVIRLIAAFTLMAFGGSAMYGAIMAIGPAAAEFGSGRAGGSLPYTSFMIGFGLGGVVMGRLADQVGIMVPALIGSCCLAAGFFAAAQSDELWKFAVSLGLFSGLLGAAATFAPVLSDISHWFTGRRGLAVGIAASGTYAAGAFWPPVIQHYFDTIGWRDTYLGLGIIVICVMVPLSLVLYKRVPRSVGSEDHKAASSKLRALGFSPLRLQCLLYVAGVGCCAAMAMPQVHIVPHSVDLGFTAAHGARMLALMLGFGIVSRLVSGWISDRIGGTRTLVLGSTLQGLVLVAFVFVDSLIGLYVLAVAFGLAQGGIVPSYTMIIRSLFVPNEAGWRIGSTLLFTIIGMAFGGWIAGALYDLTGSYTASFLNAVAFNVLNLAIAVWVIRKAGSEA